MNSENAYFSSIFNNSSVGIVIVDENTNLIDVNKYMFEYFKLNPKEYKGKRFGNVFGCAYVSDGEKICGTAEECNICELRNGVLYVLRDNVSVKDVVVSHSFMIENKNIEKWFKISASPVLENNKKYVIISFIDISDMKFLEYSLRENEAKYKMLFENMTQGFALHEIILNSKGKPIDYRFLDINNAFEKLTGLKKENVTGKTVKEVMPNTEQYWLDTYSKVALTGEPCSYENFSAEIGRYYNTWVFRPQIGQFAVIFSDISERKELENKLKYYYYHDQLTNLYNRRYIFENLLEIDNSKNFPLSIISADINGLRSINEAYGYNVGDEIIKKISHIISEICEKTCIVSRWDGDEFVVLLPNMTTEKAQEIVFKINQSLNEQNSKESPLSVSFGIATKNDKNDTLKKVIRLAEENMLNSKTYESLSIQSSSITMILQTLHEKNKREEAHSRRVSEVCVAIGKAMGMDPADINKLKIIGLVHDIGKIGIDEHILNKAGKLNNSECNEVKQHTEIGYRILSANKQTSELAFYVLSHHERLDGTGYPNGIKGESITLFTRILSVADAFDAMTSKRAYSDGISRADAIVELLKFSDTQFDKEIVHVFINKVLLHNADL